MTEVTIAAGRLADARAPTPPPKSWASREDTHVAIWTLRMAPLARFTLPHAAVGVNRSVYFFRGAELRIAGRRLEAHARVVLDATADVELAAGPDGAELLLLQGRPIAEPVVQYGPFVMNTRAEIQQAMLDYQRTQFGGWPWPTSGPVHAQGPWPLRPARRRPDRRRRRQSRRRLSSPRHHVATAASSPEAAGASPAAPRTQLRPPALAR